MKLLAFLFGVVVLLVIVGNCSERQQPKTQAQIKENEDFQWATAGALTLRDAMRNPDSFKLESVHIMPKEKVVCYQYRSQNGFGGMTRGNAVITKDKMSTSENNPGFARIWNKECLKGGEDKTRLVARAVDMVR